MEKSSLERIRLGGAMITREASEFFSHLQTCVFVRHGAKINPETKLPDDINDWELADIDDCASGSIPGDKYGKPMRLWAIIDDDDELDELHQLQGEEY